MIENYVLMDRQHYLSVFQDTDLQSGSLATNRALNKLSKLKMTQDTTNFIKQVERHSTENQAHAEIKISHYRPLARVTVVMPVITLTWHILFVADSQC